MYFYICILSYICWSLPPSHHLSLREVWCNERHARGCFLLPSFLFFVLCFPLYTQYSCVCLLCGPFSPVTTPPTPYLKGAEGILQVLVRRCFSIWQQANPEDLKDLPYWRSNNSIWLTCLAGRNEKCHLWNVWELAGEGVKMRNVALGRCVKAYLVGLHVKWK